MDLERAAADLAVGDELLAGHTGVHGQFKDLAAERTMDGFSDLHGGKIARRVQDDSASEFYVHLQFYDTVAP